MRTNCKASLFVAIFLCLTASVAFAQHSAKGKAAEDATTALLQMHSSYQQASATQKQQLLTQFTAMAAQREQLLLSLMQSNPGFSLGSNDMTSACNRSTSEMLSESIQRRIRRLCS